MIIAVTAARVKDKCGSCGHDRDSHGEWWPGSWESTCTVKGCSCTGFIESEKQTEAQAYRFGEAGSGGESKAALPTAIARLRGHVPWWRRLLLILLP